MGLLKLEALSIAAAQLAPCIACIFNACQRVAALPKSWALCGITPIHKGRKEGRKDKGEGRTRGGGYAGSG